MAVTRHILARVGAAGSGSGRDPSTAIISYSANYVLFCDDPLDGPKVALDYCRNTSDMPWYGKPYSFGNDFDAEAICQKINPQKIVGANMIAVEVGFEPVKGSASAGSEADGQSIDLGVTGNPLNWHDEIELTYTQISTPIYGAYFQGFFPGGIANPLMKTGKYGPLINSAMDPFDPVPEGELDMQVLRISRNVYPYNANIPDMFIGTVNSNHVDITKPAYGFHMEFSPQVGKIKNISASFHITNRIPYYKQTIEVHKNPLGWRLSIVDMGLNRRQMPLGDKKDDGTAISDSDMKDYKPKVTPIRDENNFPILQPVLLNGNGQPLELDKGKDPVYLQYQYYPETDWSAIPW